MYQSISSSNSSCCGGGGGGIVIINHHYLIECPKHIVVVDEVPPLIFVITKSIGSINQ
jgi:hypothetical protein